MIELTQMMDDFDRIIGLEYLRGMHLNDSKAELGSGLDRHEKIGAWTFPLITRCWITCVCWLPLIEPDAC